MLATAFQSQSPMNGSDTSSTSILGLLPTALLEAFIPGYGYIHKFFLYTFGFDVTVLVSLGVVFWLGVRIARSIYALIWNVIVSNYMSEISINSHDEIHAHLIQFLAHSYKANSARRLLAETPSKSAWELDSEDTETPERTVDPEGNIKWLNFSNQEAKCEPRFTPAIGSHNFWHDGTFFQLRRREVAVFDQLGGNRATALKDKEILTLACLGRTTEPIKKLIQLAKRDYHQGHNAKTIIKRPAPKDMRRYGGRGSWIKIAERPCRPMNTVVLDEKKKLDVLADINEYLNPATARWYANRGIPYRRGYLFFGPHGCGKSSLTYALAGIFGLDIHVISLLEPTLTEEELGTLFTNLPARCIVLLEDIDTAGLRRNETKMNEGQGQGNSGDLNLANLTKALKKANEQSEEERKTGISLAGLLNIIDGVASHEGRVLVMTTNRPEALDEALIRPGRVDHQVPFSNATQYQTRELFERMYTNDLPRTRLIPTSPSGSDNLSLLNGITKSTETQSEADFTPPPTPLVITPATSLQKKVAGESIPPAELSLIAREFAKEIPDGMLSPAEIQGFLLKRKNDPRRAVREVEEWVRDMKRVKERVQSYITKKDLENNYFYNFLFQMQSAKALKWSQNLSLKISNHQNQANMIFSSITLHHAMKSTRPFKLLHYTQNPLSTYIKSSQTQPPTTNPNHQPPTTNHQPVRAAPCPKVFLFIFLFFFCILRFVAPYAGIKRLEELIPWYPSSWPPSSHALRLCTSHWIHCGRAAYLWYNMAPPTPNGDSAPMDHGHELRPSQKLALAHEAHQATIEDVPDEEDLKHGEQPLSASILESTTDSAAAPGWVTPMSPTDAGKQEAPTSGKEKTHLDPDCTEHFPSLGGSPQARPVIAPPTWTVKKPTTNGDANGSSTSGTSQASTPTSGTATPISPAPPSIPRTGPHPMAIPGRFVEKYPLQSADILPRNQLKKPIPDILKDVNKKLKTVVTLSAPQDNRVWLSGSGPSESVVRRALAEVADQIGAKRTSKISIPRSSKSHIIGKGGVTIKAISERCRARIFVNKDDASPLTNEDDDLVEVQIEGNPLAIIWAKEAISQIAGERAANMNTKLRGIPAEFYPFLASAMENTNGVEVRVPPHYKWTEQPPPQPSTDGQAVAFLPAAGDNHIILSGEHGAIQAAREEILRRARELQRQLALEKFQIPAGRHQFIVGEAGIPADEFFAQTGCAVILPSKADDPTVTIVGPPNRIPAAVVTAETLANSPEGNTVTIPQDKDVPEHASNLARYLRDRREIERIEKLHQSYFFTPTTEDGSAMSWEVYSREEINNLRALKEFNNILNGHPPSRMMNVPVDPFYHAHLTKNISPRVKHDFGVHVVVPKRSGDDAVLLVFEGSGGSDPDFQVARGHPSSRDIAIFQRGLEDARKHILDIISSQAKLASESIEVPYIFHDRLRKFILQEQQARDAEQIPVRVTSSGTTVTLRGPEPSVEALTAKVHAFLEQAIQDEKERGFTLEFDFPQKHANQLIGKGGSKIRELRETFDVEIQVDEGKVVLKGPKAKAEKAKTHIAALGRQWADETTHILKIEPKFHRELIGAQGSQVNKLQTRYKVQIYFPHSAKPPRDDQSSTDIASDVGRRGGRREQEPDEVVVKGPKKGADEARDEILSLLQYYKDNSNSATVTVQQSQIPSLIGQRGASMDELRTLTGAKIDVPNARDSKDPSGKVDIQIKGTKSQVAQAKKLLEQKKLVFDQTVTKTIDVDKKHHKTLIGTGGANIRDIITKSGGSDDRRESARTVKFPDATSSSTTITIEEKQDVVDKILALIQQTISERDNQTTAIVEVPINRHSSLIGRGGETKKKLESQFNVSIDIPRQGDGQTGIKVTGLPVDVEKAKAHIKDHIKDQEGETVQVPRRIHHTIADNGQFFRRLRTDHQVTVDHAGHMAPPKPAPPTNPRTNGGSLPLITDEADKAATAFSWHVVDVADSGIDGEIPWVLHGSPNNLAKAKTTLAAAIEKALNNTSTGYLVLPDPRKYRYVIGQGGSRVNSIREATGCKITVPRDHTSDEAIEVSGSSEGVEKAKEMILQAVKEGGNVPNGNRS
ncbi:hypothetical protein B7494_g1942 [Chlorociboria aeruginascens]|nr:hypothetical protein B7494_g1942 [Chlorociboria aeruginascens]